MSQRLYLGVDIGTYETKGVLVKQDGKIISTASRKHKIIAPMRIGGETLCMFVKN